VPEPSDYSAEVQALLAELGLEPVLIGALAALVYRRTPRATTDVDFLVRRVTGLADRLRELGYEVYELREGDEEPYVVFARGGGRRIDVLRAETEYQRTAIARAVDGVLTAEDVIVHKLIAWRPRDRDDVAEILSTGRPLDVGYIRRWAEAWDVLDRWQQASGA
jgi:hypothetical protein